MKEWQGTGVPGTPLVPQASPHLQLCNTINWRKFLNSCLQFSCYCSNHYFVQDNYFSSLTSQPMKNKGLVKLSWLSCFEYPDFFLDKGT